MQGMHSDRQLREIFHFCFLQHLLKISAENLYILKGGVNLRFFFHSPRYSEDMDLDVNAGNITTLKKNGYKILADAAFARSLKTYGIESIAINDPAKAKHTETTQRFRVRLLTQAGEELPTKIEFSRRNVGNKESSVDMINPELARQYNRLAYRCRHYPAHIAVLQKINALAGRAETQTRDAFDLMILHAGGHTQAAAIDKLVTRQKRNQAIEKLMALSFREYEGQVLEYLEADAHSAYGGPQAWASIQETVMRLLQ
ncbi:MAG TPA: nucleotidyl transferase AbiEii/AbiGii toxin family protein [Gammaproteobacteria bacterium]